LTVDASKYSYPNGLIIPGSAGTDWWSEVFGSVPLRPPVVRVAGVMAAKRTAELVPFCHPLKLTDVDVEAVLDPSLPGVRLDARVRCVERTGAEMEALTACAVAGLTVIDMVKAVDPWASVEGLHVVSKSGGSRGSRRRPAGRG